jgi:MYXO-CTERM domain-containing protein
MTWQTIPHKAPSKPIPTSSQLLWAEIRQSSPGPTCIRQYRCEHKNKRAPADYRPAPGVKAPAPIDLGVLPRHELPSCGSQSCPGGQLCLPLSLCIPRVDTPKPGVTPIVASCEHDAPCPEKSVCTRSFRCVDARALHPTQDGKPVTKQPAQRARLPGEDKGIEGSPRGHHGGCAACATVGPRGHLMWLAGLAAAVGLLLRRRRRR